MQYFYLVDVQFLGFRYHGWQKQPSVKTVQGMIEKTLTFIFEHEDFKILGASRTDAMVSAHHAAFELFVKEPLDKDQLLEDLNDNLPNDIIALSVTRVDKNFNIIQHSKTKEYLYLFSYGKKNHPFCAPFMVYMKEGLDIELMKQGAKLFEGVQDFRRYCYKPSPKTIFERKIDLCEIVENDVLSASFFPEHSYLLRVKGKGFMRHQVRLMMGTLFSLGKGELTLSDIGDSLNDTEIIEPLSYIAPASGLMLNAIEFD